MEPFRLRKNFYKQHSNLGTLSRTGWGEKSSTAGRGACSMDDGGRVALSPAAARARQFITRDSLADEIDRRAYKCAVQSLTLNKRISCCDDGSVGGSSVLSVTSPFIGHGDAAAGSVASPFPQAA